MAHIESSIVDNGSAPAIAQSPRQRIATEQDPRVHRRLLDRCLGVVEQELRSDRGSADVARTRATLAEVAGLARAEDAIAEEQIYAHFVQHLVRIYAHGCDQRDNVAFADTAAAYAAVIEAISRAYPRLDYTVALGQLLEFMARLFAARDNSWKTVYEHLRAVPDSVHAKQTLNRVCSAAIREWFDAGVQNLFSLKNDLTAKIRQLAEHARQMERQILDQEAAIGAMLQSADPEATGKVLSLQARLAARRTDALRHEKDRVRDEQQGTQDTLLLIESDIREFENLLREARRAYFVRMV
jgi:hypothetical protein